MKFISRLERGFSFIEVLAGIAIFAIGILGLALLQTNLTRSQADANARGVATAISERLIEETRGFAHLADDGGSGLPIYTNITAAAIEAEVPSPYNVGGVDYTVDARVFDYRWNAATSRFVCWPNANNDNDARCTGTGTEPTLPSDYKLIEVETSWTGADFVLQEGTDAGRLGSGTVLVSTVITSVPTGINAKVQTAGDGGSIMPGVPYNPGQAPEVIAIDLGDNLKKETTTPEPEVLRDEYVETTWEVITYTTNNFFQRREEFVAVSCACTLESTPALAYTPVFWAGDEYAGGELVTKTVGSSANNLQSPYCVACCRDHHDDASAVSGEDPKNVLYRPFDSDRVGGNHKHYDLLGNLAAAGSNYLESCRLVRKDGFFRVAQDLRQEDLHVVPADWLDSGGVEQQAYSDYITTATLDFYTDVATSGDYTASPPCINGSGCVESPTYGGDWDGSGGARFGAQGDKFPSWTSINHDAGELEQLRSRALYIDYLSDDLRDAIECLDNLTPPVNQTEVDGCTEGQVDFDARNVVYGSNGDLNKLALIPFFELQLTKLAKWIESPLVVPVDVTSEPILDNNAHSRGVASSSTYGGSEVSSYSYRGNLALTDTSPVRPNQAATSASLIVQALDSLGGGGTDPLPPTGFQRVSGFVTTVGNISFDVEGLNGANCGTPTIQGYQCDFPATGTPLLRVYGYGRNNRDIYVCPLGNILTVDSNSFFGTRDAETSFRLYTSATGAPAGSGWNLVIQEAPCATVVN